MADDDTVLSDEETSSFLSGSEPAAGVSFSLASGLNASRIASVIVGSVVFAVSVGVNTIIQAVTSAYSSVIDGLSGFLAGRDGLIDVVFESGLAAIRAAWSFSLSEFGVFAFPVAVAVLTGSLIVVQRGIDQIREVAS